VEGGIWHPPPTSGFLKENKNGGIEIYQLVIIQTKNIVKKFFFPEYYRAISKNNLNGFNPIL
jgi:hypothetical protein